MGQLVEERIYHTPALLEECMEGLNLSQDGVYVDVTFGGGGHSREILNRIGEKGHLYGFDQDLDALKNKPNDERFTFVRSNFAYLENFMRYYEVPSLDGILADLGVSSHHFDVAERGFSFQYDGVLDMRMNTVSEKTAEFIVNNYDEEQLADIFYLYGELKSSRKLARAVVQARNIRPIKTTTELANIVRSVVNIKQEKKNLAQLFQALRIEVNDEMLVLEKLLTQSLKLLKPGGRLVVISYHSLEDRMVKNFFRSGNLKGIIEKDFFGNINSPFKLINRKVIVPTEDECRRNSRARSAKLRIAEKKGD